MVGDQDHDVGGLESRCRQLGPRDLVVELVFTDVGIVGSDRGTKPEQVSYHVGGWRLAGIARVLLVGQTQ